jgi:hypothetical protein
MILTGEWVWGVGGMILTGEWVGGVGGMILTGENRNTLRKICPDATVSTTNRTLTGLGSNPGERPAINRLRFGFAFSRSVSYVYFVCISYLRACYLSVLLVIDLITLLQYSANV